MTINKCRVCENDFFEKPLLRYENMPSTAQYLPDIESLERDKGIVLEVCQCSKCGLVQLNNEPVPYYKEVIRASGFSEEMKNFRLEQFKEFTKKYSLGNKKIIEIGCGRGEYLSLMQNFITNSSGLEYSESSVIQGNREGLRISKGFIEKDSDRLKNSPFDGFYILSFLEHLPNINSVLKGISNNLTEKAVGIIEVPNFDMILERNLFSEFARDHLFYFTEETLSSTLNRNGFEIIECKEIWQDYIISAVVKKKIYDETNIPIRKKEKLDLSEFNNHQNKITRELTNYINQFGDKKTAIWGAGHQSFSILSLAKLEDKIRYVVDSATFKQGKYTPATHIPIVHPDTLMSNPVDSIIIMAGSYSDEVSNIIKIKYKNKLEDKVKKINIAILRDFGLEEINE
ncbi:MAG: methyltransferase domain-containing protein [Candidatus Nanoarchaeia archaeon]|nr:methyltransferase domain-containing protein [Candidatus Nanoarchaeia archaeon]MDD5358108.1 methyltransferase domain-containing protein [Candidatus Nanoarchaeia archaeon]MDD5589295.1 methyltransferase domain-containing protein [Candidatus Nanoarchaeia archaeon]